MLDRAAKPLVKLVERYLPDPFIFVLILTLVAFAAATGVRLWSSRLSQSRQALPAMQQELYRQVQNALALIIPDTSQGKPAEEYRITQNFAAFDAYMQAQQRLLRSC